MAGMKQPEVEHEQSTLHKHCSNGKQTYNNEGVLVMVTQVLGSLFRGLIPVKIEL